MATPSPICEVKDGSGSYQSTTGGVDVTPGNTVTIRLASTSGVDVWSIQCVSTDETSTAPTLSVNYTNKTATFTAPAAGKALRFKSTVKSQSNKVTSSATFGIYTLTGGGYRVVAYQETTEGNADFGWTDRLNSCIRTLPITQASSGLYADRPASPVEGTEYIPTDGGPRWFYIGGVWRPIPGGFLGKAPPAASNWTGRNAGTSTLADTNGGLYMVGQNDGSNTYIRGFELTSNSTTGYMQAKLQQIPNTATVGFDAYAVSGVFLAESMTGKIMEICLSLNCDTGKTVVAIQRWDSPTSRVYSALGACPNVNSDMWLRVKLSGSNVLCQYSVDRCAWVTLDTTAKTTAFTSAPDRCGITMSGRNVVPGMVIWDLEYA